MKESKFRTAIVVCISSLFFLAPSAYSETLSITPGVTVLQGAVNGVILERNGKSIAIYGEPESHPAMPEKVLFTHARRDVIWAGKELVRGGAEAVVPAGEELFFRNAQQYWNKQQTARFHDYDQQTTRVPVESFQTATPVKGGDTVEWQGLSIHVVDTPGYTRKAVSYVFEMNGKKIACTGDLIYGDGKILDLYSLQDSIEQPKTRGYHGFMARAANEVASLQTIAAASPDILIPARGPIVKTPQESIQKLITRLRKVYENYLSTSALRWYWKDEYIQGCAARMLGKQSVDWMPMAETLHPYPPEWLIPIGTSRLILSQTGNGFLLDCGSPNTLKELKRMQQEGRLKNIDGVYVTHYHDDHTDRLNDAVEAFGCRLYFCREQYDILTRTSAYRMPAQTDQPVQNQAVMQEGESVRWNEFELTSYYFPGQTLYHGGLIVKKEGGETIFFIGDSFTPSGMDDYCALNRNFLHPNMGYFYCLDFLKRMKPDCLLVNEHVKEPFRFSPEQLEFMVDALTKRVGLLSELLPWDDINYGLDEQWIRFYPYGIQTRAGQRIRINIAVFNHSSIEQTFTVTPHAPTGWHVSQVPLSLTIPPRQEKQVPVDVTPAAHAKGVSVITADVSFGDWDLRNFAEAMVSVAN